MEKHEHKTTRVVRICNVRICNVHMRGVGKFLSNSVVGRGLLLIKVFDVLCWHFWLIIHNCNAEDFELKCQQTYTYNGQILSSWFG
jgi:hypothetical protein